MQRQQREQKKVVEKDVKKPEEPKPAIDEDKIYLIDPKDRQEIQIPDEVLDRVTEKAISRAKHLAKRTRKQMEKEVNNVLFSQLQKLEIKFEFLRKFKQLYEQEKKDIQMIREECLAERVALSALKSQSAFPITDSSERNMW